MNLDDRMKAYEESYRFKLPIRQPVVIRVDGNCFHTLTKDCPRPFDENLRGAITDAAMEVLEDLPARMAYHQSDEVSFLLIDYNKYDSQQWFDGIVQKMASISASKMGIEFTARWGSHGAFDARVFPVPERDIKNYFIWRQQDAMRNALTMAAQAHFSHKELQGKNGPEKTRMLAEKGITFDKFPSWFRFGSVVTKKGAVAAPIFSKKTTYMDEFLTVEDA